MKQSPKSCGCLQCRHSAIKKIVRTKEERAFRRASKIELARGVEVIAVAPYGSYIA